MKITVTFDALDEFNAFMGKQLNLVEPASAQTPTRDWYPGGSTMDERELASVEPQEKPAEPVKQTEEKTTPKSEAPAEKPEAPAEKAVQKDDAVDLITARKVLANLNKRTGENTAHDLTMAFGYERLKEVPADLLPKIVRIAELPASEVRDAIADVRGDYAN